MVDTSERKKLKWRGSEELQLEAFISITSFTFYWSHFFVFSVLIETPLEREITCCVCKKKKKIKNLVFAGHPLPNPQPCDILLMLCVVRGEAFKTERAAKHCFSAWCWQQRYQIVRRYCQIPWVDISESWVSLLWRRQIRDTWHYHPYFIQTPMWARRSHSDLWRNRRRRDTDQMASVFLPLNGYTSQYGLVASQRLYTHQ